MKVKQIAELTGGILKGNENLEIFGVASIENARDGEISFIEKTEKTAHLENSKASCFFVPSNFESENAEKTIIFVQNPKLSFAKIAAELHPQKKHANNIHQSAIVSAQVSLGTDIFIDAFVCIGENSVIGNGTQIRAGAKIGDDVRIGKNCIIHPNVSIEDGCTIGNNVILHSGVIIGADGFGYVRNGKDGYIKFPQIGTVLIENDVEIGANSCVDRGALGETIIGEGTKIDNLVQVAHNVRIGKRCVIAAQTGISGSTVIEDDCIIGGQVGFGDHATVKSGAIIGSQAGILPRKIVREGVWWGTPVQPLDEFKRQNAHLKGISRLKEEVKNLKKQIDELSK